MADNEKLEQLFSEQQHMVLAVTLDDGAPWAVPVRIQARNDNVFEWDSALETVHSQAVAVRPDMALAIFQKKEDSQIGFYAKGKAELMEEFKPGFGRYKFVAEKCWINDETFVKREVAL